LINSRNEFPKYPYFFNPFVRTDSINVVKIYESTLDNTDVLLNTMVGCSELEKKTIYDKIPSSLDKFLSEVYFQYAYVSTPTDLYNYDLIIRSFVSEYQYRNFFSDLYAPVFYSSTQSEGDTAGLEDGSSLYQYMLYSSLYNIISQMNTLYPSILRYLTYINEYGPAADRVNQATILADFQAFVTDYSFSMSVDLSHIISRSVYDYQNISQTMLDDLINVIRNKLTNLTSGFYQSFYDFYGASTYFNPVQFLANNFIRQLNAFAAADIMSRIHNDYTIVNEGTTISQVQQESDTYASYMGKIELNSLKNYLFLCFLYKFWPLKFLNILQLTLKEYTEKVIKRTTVDDLTTEDTYGSLFEWFASNYVDFANLRNFLEAQVAPAVSKVTYGSGTEAKFTFTPGSLTVTCMNANSYNAVNLHDYIYAEGDSREHAGHVISKNPVSLTLTLDAEYTGSVSDPNVSAYRYNLATNYFSNITPYFQIGQFACLMYGLVVLEEYFKSSQYDNFVEELSQEIFNYLRNNGHVEYDYDWYEYHDAIDIYFKIYLRWKLLDTSRKILLPSNFSASYKFTNGSDVIYCANRESYDAVSDGDFIVSEYDQIFKAEQVSFHTMVGSQFVLVLTHPYTGGSTEDKMYETAYKFSSFDAPLFNTLTQNFCTKLLPVILTNTTADPVYDYNIIVPSETGLASSFRSFAKSRSFIRGMHQFYENLVLSTLTREIIYSVLYDFVE